MNWVLVFAAVGEAGTGLALLVVPSLVGRLDRHTPVACGSYPRHIVISSRPCVVGKSAGQPVIAQEEGKMKKISVRIFTGLAVAILSVVLLSCSTMPLSQPMSQSQIEEQRASIRGMARETLSQLYQEYPEAKSKVNRAAGYAIFSDFGYKYMFMGSATGQGIAVSQATKRDTYMKMVELQPGYGFGIQKFKNIFLFDTQDAFDTFVNSGWEFGSTAAAAAQTSTQGGGAGLGVSVSPGVTMYQISETGALVGVSVTGAKYYKDDALN